MAFFAAGVVSAAVVGGAVVGGTYVVDKNQKANARQAMLECGPIFLNEGLTVQDLWADFEGRLLAQGVRKRTARSRSAAQFQELCRGLGYNDNQTFLLLRTWHAERKNRHLLKQPYLRTLNNPKYERRQTDQVRSYVTCRDVQRGSPVSAAVDGCDASPARPVEADTAVMGIPVSEPVSAASYRPYAMPRVPAGGSSLVTPGGPSSCDGQVPASFQRSSGAAAGTSSRRGAPASSSSSSSSFMSPSSSTMSRTTGRSPVSPPTGQDSSRAPASAQKPPATMRTSRPAQAAHSSSGAAAAAAASDDEW
eukprot:TRINITY_DN434_c0_g3_i1.p1 TRINITY_DN434_c0_g3~~TRINITY_DN434_c0_g3_i1.p1  ORF type:complete len:307 (+),score=33.49 TRINITY_DN434_c0_g3_i1:123-1043(+)